MLADCIICYSAEGARMLAPVFPGKEILVAGNSNLLARDCRSIEGVAEERNCVLFLGRLVPEKRVALLINALCILQARGEQIGARIVGDGPEKSVLEDLVRRHQLKDVVFPGYIKNQDKIREFAAGCFALACPGTAGLALTQAQSMGLPFIFCPEEDNGPETEMADVGINCLNFAHHNAESLAQALASMYRERELWLSRSHDYVRRVSTGYTIEAMAATFADFFRVSGKTARWFRSH
jgi:glycosyltransferase involved in cell wall biosynthesis